MKSVESPFHATRPPARELYAFAVALVVSATSVMLDSVESNNTTLRPLMSFTSNLPPGKARTADTEPRSSFDLANTAPSGLMAGS